MNGPINKFDVSLIWGCIFSEIKIKEEDCNSKHFIVCEKPARKNDLASGANIVDSSDYVNDKLNNLQISVDKSNMTNEKVNNQVMSWYCKYYLKGCMYSL